MTIQKTLFFGKIDTRLNYYQISGLDDHTEETNIKTNAHAVACLMDASFLQANLSGDEYKLHQKTQTLADRVISNYNSKHPGEIATESLPDTENFVSELAPGFGSAFLVREDKIITAGHCVCKKGVDSKLESLNKLNNIRIVFNFIKKDPTSNKITFTNDDVYKIDSVIDFKYNSSSDYAIIKLDRSVMGKEPIKVDFTHQQDEELFKGRQVYVLGCPNGTAVKCAGLGYATINTISSNVIKGKFDTFAGNSGSPLIDRITNKAIGILIRGQPDYKAIESNDVNNKLVKRKIVINRMSSGEETCQRILPTMLSCLTPPDENEILDDGIANQLPQFVFPPDPAFNNLERIHRLSSSFFNSFFKELIENCQQKTYSHISNYVFGLCPKLSGCILTVTIIRSMWYVTNRVGTDS